MFKDKVLVITGGTGSFGKAVLKRFANTDIKEIRIFSRDEKKQEEIRNEFRNPKITYHIGDVRDYESVRPVMRNVDFVFSAAALKQVPACEFHPIEAVKTNILGTKNVLRAAIDNNVKRVVVLSTDKAVYPINAMGMSKALMEKVTISMSRDGLNDGTVMCNTRYGNVMASRGSIIPLFISQILEKKPLTITDPTMTRFIMSLDEAVDLVIFAFLNGETGDTFVQKAPATTTLTLAEALLDIFNADNEIKIIGTRHGEKKHETLLSREEFVHSVDMGNYYKVPADNRSLDYSLYVSEGEKDISQQEDYTSANTKRLTKEEVKEKLLTLDYVKDQLKRSNICIQS